MDERRPDHAQIPHETAPAVAAFTLRTEEPDEFAGALLGGSFEYLRLPGRRFAATLRTLRLGDLLIQTADDGAHVSRAAFHSGIAGLLVPLHYDGDTATVNGVRSTRSNAFLAPGGLEFAAVAPDSLGWAALALPMTLLEELAELAPPALRKAATIRTLELPGASLSRLSAVLGAAARMTEHVPAALDTPGTAEALAASIREALAESLAPGIGIVPQRRATRNAMRVVRDAEAFLHAHLDRPLHRDDLCAALGVSRRKLHDAFVSTVGLTPPAYLKTRRLTLVRRALKAAPPERSLVKSIALAHGFWHLGYFAKDYRALFGELPSETLDKVQPRDMRDRPGRLRIA